MKSRNAATLRISALLYVALLALPTAQAKEHPNVPKGYEMPGRAVSPDGRFAVLYPVRDEEPPFEEYPPNLLVKLEPFEVLAKLGKTGLPQNVTTSLEVEWHGNDFVAIYPFRKWGILDLQVYELAEDKVKRVHPVWKEARKFFEKDIRARLLKKYPKESPTITFLSEEGEENPRRDFRFEGHKLLLDLLADNKPNVAVVPHWSARLLATWNLDTAKFEKTDFRPGRVSVRPNP